MAKISDGARQLYAEKIAPFKTQIQELEAKDREGQEKGKISPYERISLAENSLAIASYYLLLDWLSREILGLRSEAFFSGARKNCLGTILYLEGVFTKYVTAPYSEYAEKVEAVGDYPEFKRYELIRLIGLTISRLKSSTDENSKWRWTIVELEGRMATLSKNVIDMKKFITGLDPRMPGHQDRVIHRNLTAQLLGEAADQYRLKYELSSDSPGDFRQAISYLHGLRLFLTVLRQPKEVEVLNKKIEAWEQKLERDSRSK